MLQSLRNFWVKSWTNTWAGIQSFAGALLLASEPLNKVITNPELKAQIASMSPPPWVALLIVLFAAITYVAAEHKPKAPDVPVNP